MAVYTDITDTELEAFLEAYDLGRPIGFKGIAEGVENSNFLLETDRGRYFLTVYEKRVRREDLPFFLGLMQWLAGHGFPCAAPVANRAGEVLSSMRDKPAAIVGFLQGLSVRRPRTLHCRAAGEGLGWMHCAVDGFTGNRINTLGQSTWAGLFEPLAGAADALKPGLAKTIAGDLRLLADAWPTDLPQGVIHADYFPDNVFFLEGQFAAAFDYYFAATDALAYDIAVALNAWCFEPDGSFNVTNAAAFLDGYQRRRTLSAAELAALPVLSHGAAMRFFLTRLHDWGPVPVGSLVRPKDPMEYERKLAVHRAGLTLTNLNS